MSNSKVTKKESFFEKVKTWEIWERKGFKVLKKILSILPIIFAIILFCLYSPYMIVKTENFRQPSINIAIGIGLVSGIAIIIFYFKILKNEKSSITSIILCFIIIPPIFTYLICFLFQYPQNALVGTVDAWIGFSGSLFGGIITLIGVWWTIESQNKNKMDELHSTYKPIIVANSPTKEEFYKLSKDPLFNPYFISFNNEDSNKELGFTLYLYLSNIGRAEAIDLMITRIRISYRDKMMVKHTTESIELTQTVIYQNSKVFYAISFFKNDFIKEFMDFQSMDDRFISIDIECKDIYNKILHFDIYICVSNIAKNIVIHAKLIPSILGENCTICSANKLIKNKMDNYQIWDSDTEIQ